jgi:hypothetical protein
MSSRLFRAVTKKPVFKTDQLNDQSTQEISVLYYSRRRWHAFIEPVYASTSFEFFVFFLPPLPRLSFFSARTRPSPIYMTANPRPAIHSFSLLSPVIGSYTIYQASTTVPNNRIAVSTPNPHSKDIDNFARPTNNQS